MYTDMELVAWKVLDVAIQALTGGKARLVQSFVLPLTGV